MKVSQREILLQLPETELEKIAKATQTAAQLVLGKESTLPHVHLQYNSPAKPGVLCVETRPVLPKSSIKETVAVYVHPIDVAKGAQKDIQKFGDELAEYDIPRNEIVNRKTRTHAALRAIQALIQAYYNDSEGTLDTVDLKDDLMTIQNETLRMLGY